ncbi:hypothetical protein, partial [Flavobacterium aquicola]|uniref:hypothetical protein n=1 Tax=Flavobacterium aquicola TaxID=1682742 RepID=UPI001B86DD79
VNPDIFSMRLRAFIKCHITFWHYSGFGTKLSLFFGFAKSSQIQNHLSIKPNAQIRCSGC